MSGYKGPPISVDDADNIRRFIEQMGRSTTANSTSAQAEDNSAVMPTTTEENTESDRDASVTSTNSSPLVAPEHNNIQAYDMQSPLACGVLAPPPTPNMPLGNEEIGKMIHDQVNALPNSSTFSLGDSRYAPKKPSLLSGVRPGVHVSSSPTVSQMSTEQRKDHDLSFARMSFVTSEEPPPRFPKLLSKQAGLSSKELDGASVSYLTSSSAFKEAKHHVNSNDDNEETPEMDKPASKGRSPLMDNSMLVPHSSEIMDQPTSESTTVSVPQDIKKSASSEEGTRAQAHTPPPTPPHLRASKKYTNPLPSLQDMKIKDEPVDDSTTAHNENTPLNTRAKPSDESSRDMAEAQAAKTLPARSKYSPSNGTLAAQIAKMEESMKNALYFTSWPKLQRDQPVSRARKVVLVDLPPASSPVFVTSLIHGGPLEQIALIGPTSAYVLFLDPDDALKFYKATDNGIECQKEGVKYVILTEMNRKDVDVVGGKLRQWIDSGMTRCVRAVGVDEEWTLGRLYGLAEAKNRKVEVIEVGENPGGLRSVVFRFCKIDHAVEFKASISRLDDWEQCNIHFSLDPCAEAPKASATK